MGRRSSRQEKPWCPICGKVMPQDSQHRCSQNSLNAIDGKGKSDHNNSENRKPYWVRLQHGFESMRLSDDSIDARSDED